MSSRSAQEEDRSLSLKPSQLAKKMTGELTDTGEFTGGLLEVCNFNIFYLFSIYFSILHFYRSFSFLFLISWSIGSSKRLPIKDLIYRKAYFYAKGEDGKAMPEFRKDVFMPIENAEHVVVIHYIGNDSIFLPSKHGNSMKQTKLFFRTKPSVLKKMATELEHKAPHKVYKEMVSAEVVSSEATDKPRNVKQL